MKTIVYVVFIFLSCGSAYAEMLLEQVIVHCDGDDRCDSIKKRSSAITGRYLDYSHLNKNISFLFTDGGYVAPSYKVFNRGGIYIAEINAELKSRVRAVSFAQDGREIKAINQFSMIKGNYYNEQKMIDGVESLRSYYRELGYPRVDIDYTVKQKNKDVDIGIKIRRNQPLLLKKVNVLNVDSSTRDIIQRKLRSFTMKPFNFKELRKTLDGVKIYFTSFGYYLFDYTSS